MNTIMHSRISACALTGFPAPEPFAESLKAFSNTLDRCYGISADQMSPEEAECVWIPGIGNAHQALFPLKLREGAYSALSDYWISRAFEALCANDLSRAGRMSGCWSHLCGDTAQVAHLADERDLADFFPQKNACYVTHNTLEQVSAELPVMMHSPRLLARSLHELQWRAVEELVILQRREKPELPIMLAAVEARDHAAQVRSAERSALHAAELLADVIYTLFALTGFAPPRKYDPPDLRKLIPLEEFCDSYYNYRSKIDLIPGTDPYTPLPTDIGTGPIGGISMLVSLTPFLDGVREAYAEYALPGENVFESFTVLCGLQRGVKNESSAVFQIFLDGKSAVETPPVDAASPPRELKLSLGNARKLRLRVIDARKDARKTKFFYPVWALPRFHSANRFLFKKSD